MGPALACWALLRFQRNVCVVLATLGCGCECGRGDESCLASLFADKYRNLFGTVLHFHATSVDPFDDGVLDTLVRPSAKVRLPGGYLVGFTFG